MLIGNKAAVRTPEFHKKKERERKIKNALLLVVVIILSILPIYILRTSKLQIVNIHLQGNAVTKDEDIQRIVALDLEGRYAHLFPRSSVLIYPKKQIEADLLRALPRLSAVDLSLQDTHTLLVSVSEREPVALYCADVSNPNSPAGCAFLDDQGFLFATAPSFSTGVYEVYSSDPAQSIGESFLTPAAFAPLTPFLKSLGEAGIFPKALVSKAGDYHLILASGGEIILKSDADLEQIRSSLSALVLNPTFTKEGSLDNLLYIDARYGNKVFYKFR